MPEFIITNKIFVILVNIISLWLGFWVYFSNRKNKINQIFFLWVISTSIWITLYYLVSSSTQLSTATFLAKLGHGAVSIFYIPFYLFFVYFLHLEKKLKSLTIVISITAIALFVLSIFTNLIVKGVEIVGGWRVDIILGKGAVIFYLMAIFLSVFVIILLLKNYFKFPKEEKLKIQYFLIGIFIWIIGNFIFNMVTPILYGRNIYYYAEIGNYSVLFLFGFTAYAIVKQKLFGVKVVLTTLLVGVMTILLMTLPFFMPNYSLKILTVIALFLFLIFGFLLIRSTYTEVKRKEEAESLLKAKTEFLSIASHQLRTPLTAILGYSSMLKEEDYGAIPEKAGKALNHIYDSSQRMIKLVNDFLSVSRMETGKTVLKIKETSMNELINQVISDLELRAKERNLYVKYDRPATDHIIRIDPEKIKEVLSNLIDNAIHYTEKGGITVSTKENNARTTILVSDTGAGMTPEEIDKIFESFSRGSAGNELNTQGSGLGLYIAKKFVELHNGKIWAVSEGKDKGSIFYVELPNK